MILRTHPGFALVVLLAGGLALPNYAPAAKAASAAPPAGRLQLRHASFSPAGEQAGRYALRARFQRQESATGLQESDHLQLLGRFAKAGASCDANALFRDGFEG